MYVRRALSLLGGGGREGQGDGLLLKQNKNVETGAELEIVVGHHMFSDHCLNKTQSALTFCSNA